MSGVTTMLGVDPDEARRREDIHIEQLQYEHGRNTERIAILVSRQEVIQRELREIQERREKRAIAEDGTRAIGEPEVKPLQSGRKSKDRLDATRLRDAVVRLRAFTIPEIAAYLKVKPGTVSQEIPGLVERGICRDTGERFRGKQRYEYTPPAEPGAAFEKQTALGAAAPPERDAGGAVAPSGNSSELAALDKALRIVARQAIRDGWELRRTGSDHFQLIKPTFRSIPVSGTPQNPSEEARKVQRLLRTARPQAAAAVATAPSSRGVPVPHTGKLPGTSSKPGRDRKTMQRTGRKVKKKRES